MTTDEQGMVQWVVGAVATGGVSVFGFLARKAFTDLEQSITGFRTDVTAKLSELTSAVNTQHTESAVTRAELGFLKERVAALEVTMRQIKGDG